MDFALICFCFSLAFGGGIIGFCLGLLKGYELGWAASEANKG